MKPTTSKQELQIFSQNIVWLRKRYCLSKKAMARLLQISVRSLTRIEQGNFPPRVTVEIFFHVEDHFGIPPQVILTRQLDD